MLDAHPLAERIPAMSPEEYEQLVDDIGAHGLREPIVIYDGKILDGRHRYRALHELAERGNCEAVNPEADALFTEFTGDEQEALDFILSMNLHRRHLSYTQRGCLAVEYKRELQDSGIVRHGGDRSKQDADFGVLTGEAREIAAQNASCTLPLCVQLSGLRPPGEGQARRRRLRPLRVS